MLRISRVRVLSLAFCLSPKFETTKKIGFHHFSKLASMFTRTVYSQSLGSMAGISPFLPSTPSLSHFLLSSHFSRGQNIENRFPRSCFTPKSNVKACHAVSRCSNGYGSENAPWNKKSYDFVLLRIQKSMGEDYLGIGPINNILVLQRLSSWQFCKQGKRVSSHLLPDNSWKKFQKNYNRQQRYAICLGHLCAL